VLTWVVARVPTRPSSNGGVKPPLLRGRVIVLVLAFDTTSERGGVAIYRDLECLASTSNQGSASYSVTLFQMVDRVLAPFKLSLRDIELFAVATGPGSFTGIRTGVAAAQGWAQALGRPACGVSVLEAMVEEARPEADWVVPILDARRGEFFLGVFPRGRANQAPGSLRPGSPDRPAHPAGSWDYATPVEPDGPSHPAQPPGLVLRRDSLRQFLEELTGGEHQREAICCVVRAHDSASQELRALLPGRVRWQGVQGVLAGAVARLALLAHREGRLQSAAELDAYYR
jgi:tRNA threonylcarbamoyl adenosine modification protein YeaZ